MKIQFVGINRSYKELNSSYIDFFNRFHLEIPYYLNNGENIIYTKDYEDNGTLTNSGMVLKCKFQSDFNLDADITIHWRSWNSNFYNKNSINLLLCQDHTFSNEWKQSVLKAFSEKKLNGILCFPKWHKLNLYTELYGQMSIDNLFDGLTLRSRHRCL